MPLDPDAMQILEFLKTMPLPGPDTDLASYRAAQSEGAKARPGIDIARVETFEIAGPDGPVRLRLYDDVPGGDPRPTVVFMHGGGFVLCDLESHDGFCRRMAQQSGMAILAVDYRLAPEHPYPAGFEDSYAALCWAASPAGAAYGIDPARLAVAGDSAGGALAIAIAIAARDRGGPRIRHQALVYPVFDVDFETASYRDNGSGYFLTKQTMQWFWQQYLGQAPAAPTDGYAVPGRIADFRGLPPATIVTAGYDPLRDDGAAYARKLQDAGVEVAYHCMEGGFHGFAGADMLECSGKTRAIIAERLRAALVA